MTDLRGRQGGERLEGAQEGGPVAGGSRESSRSSPALNVPLHLGAWRAGPAAADPVGAYAEAVGAVLAAFATGGAADRQFALPEIATAMTFPGRQAMAFHLVDYVVHGWDVARCLGVRFEPDPEVLAIALKVAQDAPNRTEYHDALGIALMAHWLRRAKCVLRGR